MPETANVHLPPSHHVVGVVLYASQGNDVRVLISSLGCVVVCHIQQHLHASRMQTVVRVKNASMK
jgi:hypothetical protein